MGPNISAHENIDYLDCLATGDPPQSRIKLILVNRDPMRKMKVEIFGLRSNPFTLSTITRIKACNPLAYNDFNHPDHIKMEEIKSSKSQKENGQITLEPSTIYLVEYQMN
jgi:alpha-L-arabinofuranosidase